MYYIDNISREPTVPLDEPSLLLLGIIKYQIVSFYFPKKGGGVRGNRRFPGKGVVGETLVSLQN